MLFRDKRRYFKFISILCVCFLMTMGLYGCRKHSTEPPENTNAQASLQENANSENETYITLYFNDVITQEQEDALEENDERNYTQTMITQIEGDVPTAKAIVDSYNMLVIDGLYSEKAIINSVREKNGSIHVDFDSASLQELMIEEGYEGQLFYNLARSLWANIENVENIFFTMDNGKDFQLGHLWFDASRPFYYGEGPNESE